MNILLIEDDDEIANVIVKTLLDEGHEIDRAANGRDGLFMAVSNKFDVIVLDRMLPGGKDGLRILETLLSQGDNTPVLLLSGRANTQDRVDGLKAGASDYLAKPFALTELIARIESLTRRREVKSPLTELTVGEIEIKCLSRAVTRAGQNIELLSREYLLLEYFLRNAGKIVTRQQLLKDIWGYDFDPGTNIIDVHISRLRKKIDEPFSFPMLHTVRDVGYVLRPESFGQTGSNKAA